MQDARVETAFPAQKAVGKPDVREVDVPALQGTGTANQDVKRGHGGDDEEDDRHEAPPSVREVSISSSLSSLSFWLSVGNHSSC